MRDEHIFKIPLLSNPVTQIPLSTKSNNITHMAEWDAFALYNVSTGIETIQTEDTTKGRMNRDYILGENQVAMQILGIMSFIVFYAWLVI